jgi:coenzyme F420-0:L-glutamate ligase/coenzyme F420-1:gamma-L-glutamate ligase
MSKHPVAPIILQPIHGIPLVAAGDDIGALILTALADAGQELAAGDIAVVAQKIVSKAEGRAGDLATVAPSPRAVELASLTQKDPRLVELILRESNEVVRVRAGVIVVENRAGVVLANAGIDRSNVADDRALLLPVDADASAARIRDTMRKRAGFDIGVVIIDSIGRAWRNGTIGTAIGASGVTTFV